ncbi:hypothetical protein F6455_02020 [Proteobacteria bacterium 005FR1]|nr:hypothetical protein [Proteobacteria bacterium 005FR1]
MKQLRLSLSPIVLLSCLLLWACSPSEPPRTVVSAFWAATLTGNSPVLEQLVIPGTLVSADFNTARHHEIFDSVVLGETRRDGDEARVETSLEGVFFGTPGEVRFDTVLAIYEGEWRVDYAATVREMIGTLLGDSVDEVGEEMLGDIQIIDEGMNEAIRQELKAPPTSK